MHQDYQIAPERISFVSAFSGAAHPNHHEADGRSVFDACSLPKALQRMNSNCLSFLAQIFSSQYRCRA